MNRKPEHLTDICRRGNHGFCMPGTMLSSGDCNCPCHGVRAKGGCGSAAVVAIVLIAVAVFVLSRCAPDCHQQVAPSDADQVTLSTAAWVEDLATMRGKPGAKPEDVAAYRLLIAQGLSRAGAMKYAAAWAGPADRPWPELVCADYRSPPAGCRQSVTPATGARSSFRPPS